MTQQCKIKRHNLDEEIAPNAVDLLGAKDDTALLHIEMVKSRSLRMNRKKVVLVPCTYDVWIMFMNLLPRCNLSKESWKVTNGVRVVQNGVAKIALELSSCHLARSHAHGKGHSSNHRFLPSQVAEVDVRMFVGLTTLHS